MIPALVLSFSAAELVGFAFQRAFGLAESESLTEAGACGVAAAVLLTVLLVLPQILGIWLGAKARRSDMRRLGTIGIAANGAIVAFVVLTTAINLLFA